MREQAGHCLLHLCQNLDHFQSQVSLEVHHAHLFIGQETRQSCTSDSHASRDVVPGTAPGPRCGHTLTSISGPDGDLSKAKLILFGG